ncbi:MAG: dephospho-CoA kinase [Planctomycetes bacterium]|nr:dephospho-CoA kinase [Planctomycetota bacterium]
MIGVVGGIGAGKSTVAAELEALGCRLIDADAIGHDVLGEPAVAEAIRRRWGDGVLGPDGRIDRSALAEVVFEDPAELEALDELVHPPIRRRMERLIDEAMSDDSAAGVVVDAAVLFEAGWDDLCTHVLFVSAPAGERARRAGLQRSWSRREWRRREKSQIPLDIKAARSDYIVDNRSSVARLREQIRQIFHRIRVESQPPGRSRNGPPGRTSDQAGGPG